MTRRESELDTEGKKEYDPVFSKSAWHTDSKTNLPFTGLKNDYAGNIQSPDLP